LILSAAVRIVAEMLVEVVVEVFVVLEEIVVVDVL
jgi:hypothetical protein